MVTAYGVLVVTDVGKTGEHFKRGNSGTYYEEWYVELNDPTGRRGTLRWKTLTEFDTITFMLDENSEPVIWEEGMEVSTSGRSLF